MCAFFCAINIQFLLWMPTVCQLFSPERYSSAARHMDEWTYVQTDRQIRRRYVIIATDRQCILNVLFLILSNTNTKSKKYIFIICIINKSFFFKLPNTNPLCATSFLNFSFFLAISYLFLYAHSSTHQKLNFRIFILDWTIAYSQITFNS